MVQRLKERLLRILKEVPELRDIFLSGQDIENKRKKIQRLLNDLLGRTFDIDPDTPPLKMDLTASSVRTFRRMTSRRNEKLAGYSLIGYIDALVNQSDWKNLPKPRPDFFAELEHLVKGIAGRADVYPDKAPFFTRLTGARAARLRSADLSRMAHSEQK